MKDNYYFMDEFFMGIPFSFPPQQIDPPMLWFKPEHFKKVIQLCKQHALGVSVIEVYKGGYAATVLAEEYNANPYDANWYTKAYENLVGEYCKSAGPEKVLFAAWYLEPISTNESTETDKAPKARRSWWQRLFGSK